MADTRHADKDKNDASLAQEVAALRREVAALQAQWYPVGQYLGPVAEALRTDRRLARMVRTQLARWQPVFNRGPLTDALDAWTRPPVVEDKAQAG